MAAVPKLEAVLVSLEGQVATVTLNQPEKRNPLSAPMIRDLQGAFAWCSQEPAARVLVLTGAGDKAFCAGADLATSFTAEASELESHQGRRGIADLLLALRDLGKPVVGRINGHALAGGFGLACACDILLAVESATFGTPEIKVGVWPMMISAVLARNLPRKVVLEMMLLGDRWSAERMRQAGLVSQVLPSLSELDTATAEVSDALAKKSPAILRLGREAFYRMEDMSLDEALAYLHSQLTLVTLTEDAKEGVRAFFEKREPEFKGR
jgi:enoyl-CoA hydratase/carnithine racemase